MNLLHWLSRPELAALALALVHFLWQGTLIALLLAAVVRLLAIQRAAQRYACSLAALLAMALCPVVTFLAISSPRDRAVAATADPVPPIALASALTNESMTAESSSLSLRHSASALARGAQPYLLALWLGGVAALGLRLMGGLIGVIRLSRRKLPLPLALASRVKRLGNVLRMDALPRVFLSRAVGEALVVGFVRPVVLVPAAWVSDMPLAALEAIIAHELAHICRWDMWVILVQRLVETLLFYHPAVWWVSRQLRLEREMCCDELAVAATGRRIEYAETLELVARARLAGVRPALAAGIRGESNMKLLARVRNVLGGRGTESGVLWPAGVLAVLLPLGLWAVTWGVLSPAPAAAVAADDDDGEGDDDDDRREGRRGEDGDDREERDDKDDDRREAGKKREKDDEDDDDDDGDDDDDDEKKEGDKERKAKEARDKKELLRKFLDKEEGREEGERKDGDDLKKRPKELGIKTGEGERKDPIKKRPSEKEGVAFVKKPPHKEGAAAGSDIAELAALVKELRGEVDRLRAEVQELRGGKAGGEAASGKVKVQVQARLKAEGSEDERAELIERLKKAHDAAARNREELQERTLVKEKLLDAIRAKEQAADRQAADRKELEAKEREVIKQKLLQAAEEKERAADRQAAERKALDAKEREAIEQKLLRAADEKARAAELEAIERKEREVKEREAIERKKAIRDEVEKREGEQKKD